MFIGWGMVCLVVIMSLLPSPGALIPLPAGDKFLHLLTYFLLMSWFGCIYLPGKNHLFLGLTLVLIGGGLELIQGLTPFRSMDYRDMISNTLGISLGLLLSRTRASSFLILFERKILGK